METCKQTVAELEKEEKAKDEVLNAEALMFDLNLSLDTIDFVNKRLNEQQASRIRSKYLERSQDKYNKMTSNPLERTDEELAFYLTTPNGRSDLATKSDFINGVKERKGVLKNLITQIKYKEAAWRSP